jgi:hypothetical protein
MGKMIGERVKVGRIEVCFLKIKNEKRGEIELLGVELMGNTNKYAIINANIQEMTSYSHPGE